MDEKRNIEYRNDLMKKVSNGYKLTQEDLLWLETHSLYNEKLGYPFLKSSIEQISSNKVYDIKIEIENKSFCNKIMPVLKIPLQKGEFIVDFCLKDSFGKKTLNNTTKILALNFNSLSDNIRIVKCFSKTGCFSVLYECEVLKKHGQISFYSMESSNGALLNYAMKREPITDNKVRYYCKNPNTNDFDALIFTVEWNEKEQGNGSSVPKLPSDTGGGSLCR